MKSPESAPRLVSLFYSYSHKDEALRDELEEHLSLLKRHGFIHSWHDRKIGAGHEWQSSIDKNLETANIIVFLVSSAFLASDYCYDKEIKKALEKHEKGDARTIPVIIRPVDWSGAPFSKLQALPKNAEAVTSWANRDEAWTDVAKGIRKVIEELILSNTKGQVTQSQVQVETVQKVKEDQLEHDEKPVIPKPKLRSQPIEDLAVDEVKIMLKEKGFFILDGMNLQRDFPIIMNYSMMVR